VHIQTHILSGWCAANLFPRFSPRERLLCMLAASLADLDGLGILFGQEAYWDYHHRLGHNLAYGLVLCALLSAFATRGARLAFGVCLALYHVHLLMDFYGSGPGWGIPYFWPFSPREWRSENAWPFYSWQNITAFAALLLWTIWIARRLGRTPLEAVMPRLDRQLVGILKREPLPKVPEA
jgi:inner membrane protein